MPVGLSNSHVSRQDFGAHAQVAKCSCSAKTELSRGGHFAGSFSPTARSSRLRRTSADGRCRRSESLTTLSRKRGPTHIHMHTHTHMYVRMTYIYTYVYVYICLSLSLIHSIEYVGLLLF